MFFKRKKYKDEFTVQITGSGNKGNINIEATDEELLLSLKILVQNISQRFDIPEYDIRSTVNRALYENEIEFNTKK